MLKNAKDAAATEALEIATYTAIERLARAVGDDETAGLAASILADEEQMLQRVLREIPKLTEAVMRADVKGEGSYDLTTTGAADAVREAAEATKDAARKTSAATKRTARQARKVPGVATAEGADQGRAGLRGGPGDRALRHAHRGRDHRQAERALADRSGQDRRLRAQEPEPHHGLEPHHVAAR